MNDKDDTVIRIMLIDDERNVLSALSRLLRQDWGDRALIETHSNPVHAIEQAKTRYYDAIMSDYRMPEMDGIALLTRIRELQPTTARIILSASTDFDVLMVAINEVGISRFLPKPWDDDEVIKAVRNAVQVTHKTRDLARLNGELDDDAETAIRSRAELKRLEKLEPGITQVRWGPNGEVLLDEE
ncbi:MAG: response regulator [Rhodocyclales bacterium]|nr:response regulator [Rhodocyclales bacterium]MDB5888576.1 response regulator [Rhodocyclales bacterium]